MEKVTSIKVDEELWRRFKMICVREGVPMHDHIREWIADYVEKHERGNPQQTLIKGEQHKPYIAPKKCHMHLCPNPATCVCEWTPTGTLYACCRVHAEGHVRGNPIHWKLRDGLEVSK